MQEVLAVPQIVVSQGVAAFSFFLHEPLTVAPHDLYQVASCEATQGDFLFRVFPSRYWDGQHFPPAVGIDQEHLHNAHVPIEVPAESLQIPSFDQPAQWSS